MTDKIIIDGVDVSGCKFLNSKYFSPCGGCENDPNCHYKQLQRKEQECDRYKQALEEIREIAAINDINTCWTVITNCEQCSDKEECGMQSPLARLNLIYKKCEVLENEHL